MANLPGKHRQSARGSSGRAADSGKRARKTREAEKRPIVHVELPTTNRAAAIDFYAKLFGWTYQDTTTPHPYTLFDTGSIHIGMPDAAEDYEPSSVVFYVKSDNITADLKQIEKLGGAKLTEPFSVGGMGEMAFFTDPSGNRLALWKTGTNGKKNGRKK